MRSRLRALDPRWLDDASRRLCQSLSVLPIWHRVDMLVGYMPIQQEPSIVPFMRQWLQYSGKPLCLPRYNAVRREYGLARIRDLERDCAVGRYGILEPREEVLDLEALPPGECAFLVPGIAFGVDGARIGRGCGYYDRLIGRFAPRHAIGVCWRMQLLPAVPTEAHDRTMDCIVTEGGVASEAPPPAH